MNILQFVLDNPIKVFVGVLFLVIFGMSAIFNMPYRLIPPIEYPQISVRTSWTGASPYEMEKEIVDKQERVLKSIPGLIDIESTASNGYANITLLFDLKVDVNDAMLLVLNKLNEVSNYPDDATKPIIRASNSDSIPVIQLMIVTDNTTTEKIDSFGTYVTEIIKPYFDRVNGVSDITISGGTGKQVQIKVDADTLALYGLTVSQIMSTLTQENISISAGTLDFGSRDYRFRTIGEAKTPDDLKDIVMLSNDDSRVKLGDIADISFGYAKKDFFAKLNDIDALSIGIIAQPGADILQLTNDIESVVKRLNGGMLKDEGLKIVWISDQREYILNAISLVKSNILEGAFLAVLVLLTFLRSFRSTLVIALTIPISIIGTFFILNAFGRSLNVTSLAGIAFAVGMLVDNSIVVLENIDRHLGLGKNAFQATYDGTKEVWGAVLASTLTTVAVFLPIVFIKEEAGQLFSDIALAVSSSVGLSLIVSVLVIPVLTRVLYQGRSRNIKENRLNRTLETIGTFLSSLVLKLSDTINSSIKLRVIAIFTSMVFSVAIVYLLIPKMDYLPNGNKNLVESFITIPPGLSYKEREAIAIRLNDYLKKYQHVMKDGIPPIDNIQFISGTFGVRVSLTSEDPNNAGKLVPILTKAIAEIPGISGATSQSPLFNIGRGSGNQLIVNVAGSMDYEELTRMVNLIQNKIIENIKGVQVRVNPSPTPVYPEIQIIPDREALKSANVSAMELGNVVDTFLDGKKVGEFKDDELGTLDIVLKGKTDIRDNPDQIYSILVNSRNYRPIPISNLSSMNEILGIDRIRRYNSQRAFSIVINNNSGMVLEELTERVLNGVIQPLREQGMISGVDISTTGAASKLTSIQKTLLANIGLAILITYLLMSALFNNFLYPFIILFTLPLAATGGFLGLGAVNQFLGDQPLDVLTMLGFIMLVGIVVNNAILIVFQSLNNLSYGMSGHDAIRESLSSRIRPITMSTLTSLVGMLPLVIAPGAGSELYRGLGAVILGGLAFSTIFTMFIIPAILSFFLKNKQANKATQ